MPAAVIHCSKEYVPGLIYVAVSRVKSPNHIQVLNFSANQLLPPSHDVLELCSTSNISELSTDLTCCSQQECLDDKCFTVTDRFCDYEDEIDDQLNFPSNRFDGPVISSFEDTNNPDTPVAVELIEIFDELVNDSSSHALPSPECVEKLREHLVSVKQSQPSSAFIKEQNVAIDYLLTSENISRLDALISIMWNHVYKLIGEHLSQNADEITFNLGRQHFTDAVAGLHSFYIGADFSSYVSGLFACDQPTVAQRSIVIQLSNQIFEEFLGRLLCMVRQVHQRSEVEFKVDEMSDEGRSKVRYVGGWAIFKILTNYRRYIKANMFLLNPTTAM